MKSAYIKVYISVSIHNNNQFHLLQMWAVSSWVYWKWWIFRCRIGLRNAVGQIFMQYDNKKLNFNWYLYFYHAYHAWHCLSLLWHANSMTSQIPFKDKCVHPSSFFQMSCVNIYFNNGNAHCYKHLDIRTYIPLNI